ncbi:YdeI/OmpD-associated family protein [Sphingomonas sp. CFBP 13720]|uniref:YdeI/OmpD-associated family protein n=1 Tax=Sphingomonas sp. CFBP 13720 TaxID=2775302 RepID=UPI00313A1571
MANDFPQGTVHEAGDDLRTALRSDPAVLRRWESLTPLGRNEFLCWIEDAKQPATRQRRIERTFDEVRGGK